jgi:branched-chain amino acid transport system substrate-binding protein
MNKKSILKRLALLSVGALIIPTFATAEIKMGIILGFTGPIESLTPDMANSAELAFKEASDSGQLLGGQKISVVRADSTCIDAAAASAAAERQITSDKVVGIMGADCSGVTTAIANNVAIPNGVTMISPSATSPALSTIADNGYFFRTAPSDARQGQVLAQITIERGINTVAVTFTNNDYGKGLSDSFINAYKGLGGKVSAVVPHDEGKADYSAEVGALDASGADVLAVFGYVDQGGRNIIQGSIDSGAFDKFILADGMYGDSLLKNVDGDLSGTFGTVPGTDSKGADSFAAMAKDAGIKVGGPFTGESYDAAALLVLAMQSGGSTDRAALASNVLAVANTPGEKIMPGELGKALRILASGGAVDYVGATNVELVGGGEAAGSYKEFEIKAKAFTTVSFR